ncbi:polymer-forming cytoskeletal protein [bacterium]|nr:polymer-forming cytoskeletal protein [bacterium]
MKYACLMLFTVLFVLTMCPGTGYAEFRMGESVVVKEGTTVDDAVSVGKDVRVFGTVSGSAVALGGGNVIVENGGKVNGDAVAVGGNVKVRNSGEVNGKGVAVGGQVQIEDGGVVRGEITNVGEGVNIPNIMSFFPRQTGISGCGYGPRHVFSKLPKIFFWGPFGGTVGVFALFIVTIIVFFKLLFKCMIAALAGTFFPRQVQNMAQCARNRFWISLFIGFIGIILIPFTVLFFIITLIGIPLVPVLIITIIIAYLFGSVGTAFLVGSMLPNAPSRPVVHNALLGVLVLGLVGLMPLIGFVVKIVFGILSFGVVIVSQFGTKPDTLSDMSVAGL